MKTRLATRLALISGVVPLVVLVILGIAIRGAAEQILIGRVDARLASQVDEVQRVYTQILIDPAHAAERRHAAEKVLDDVQKSLDSLPGSGKPKGSGYWPIRVLDVDGQAFLRGYARTQGVDEPWDRATFDAARAGRASLVDAHDRAGTTIRLRSEPVRIQGQVLAVIQGAEPLAEVRTILGRLDVALLVLVPLAVALCVGGGWVLGAYALRPARDLARSVASVDAGSLGTRIAVPRDDEVGAIAVGFNAMLARLERAFGDIAAANERQRRFSADISHELRNPLTAVQTNVSVALADTTVGGETRRALDAALRAARSMARLVGDLLLIARTEASEPAGEDTIVEVGSVVAQVVEQMAHGAVATIAQHGSAPVYVRADPEHLQRVFRNLIENALDHAPAGSVVRIGVAHDAGHARITVEDSGPGIAPHHLDRVRERFFRVDPARHRARGRTGLGLTICDTLLTLCGGTLALESEVGRGTRAIVRLPALAVDAEAVEGEVLKADREPADAPL